MITGVPHNFFDPPKKLSQIFGFKGGINSAPGLQESSTHGLRAKVTKITCGWLQLVELG